MDPEKSYGDTGDPLASAWDELKNVELAEEKTPKLPEKSPDRTTNMYLRFMRDDGNTEKVNGFLESALNRDYREFESSEEVAESFADYAEAVSSLPAEDKQALLTYTGYQYKFVNSIARGFWDYDQLGPRTDEKFREFQAVSDNLARIIGEAPALGEDTAVFRGTNLDSFQGYGVSSLEDLKNLEGGVFLEQGFASTSLLRSGSFSERELDDPLRKACNIEIRYLVPGEAKDGIAVLTDDASYSKGQHEYILNRDSLAYVSKVEVSESGDKAQLDMLLIPRELYNQ